MEEDYRTVSYSATQVSELMIPAYANFGGKIHGGILLGLMDKVAYVCASKHAGSYCVTVSVEGVEFLEPVDVGEMVTMFASVDYVGRSSMVVGIKVVAENFKSRTVKHTNTSFFTMVAKDEQGKPAQVPGLILETQKEVNRFKEAIKRKELGAQFKREMAEVKSTIYGDGSSGLEGERCKVALKKED